MHCVKPKIKAMLVCDNVITESKTEKNSLIGIFEAINAPKFPCRHHHLAVYVSFSEALGQCEFKLELIRLDNGQSVFPGQSISVEASDKHSVYNLVFRIGGLVFDQPGKYEFRLFASGEICETKTINLALVK